ncbi:MAG: hypothetical protein JGK10_11155 [Microcoleus sp. PH2017_13_LAR_U_A]|jgi:hypothetical protein|nr:hypothetical protein [Microcoleus sp. PH2017_13_LAR_U_A]MCC3469201.1 hypothetical protein [Microcoleus sp. PH2017_06_SFM_O_A]MCC3472365.1 hypothetical protein [Microcoleus sp. PH2017_13_LAR_U_A]
MQEPLALTLLKVTGQFLAVPSENRFPRRSHQISSAITLFARREPQV